MARGDSSRRKRRPAAPGHSNQPPPSTNSVVVVRSSVQEDLGDRGRAKSKAKPRSQTVYVDDDSSIITNIVQDALHVPNANVSRSKRKDRSRSLEASLRHSRKTTTPELAEDIEEPMYTGPLAQADYHRMKQEVENLRKVFVHD